jgi:regulatory protein
MPRAPKLLDAGKLLDYALRTLSGRAHSLGQLREKLRRRAENSTDIDGVILKLKEMGYLNDRQFAESFASSRLNNAGLGRMRVLRDLRQQRVAPKLAEQVVQQTFENTDETQLIEAYLERKYRGKNLPQLLADPKNLASIFRRLRYAGFSAGNAIRVLKRYSQMADELETMDLSDAPEGEDRS